MAHQFWSYSGFHSADYRLHPNQNTQNDGGYDLDIFLNQEHANNFICAMYDLSFCPFSK